MKRSGGRTADAPLPRLTSRRDIQGLRAVAVLLVILNHFDVPFSSGGYIGVDVFFVVSGYLISSLLLHEATSTGRVSVLSFYARRARRILPAATLVLVATTVFAALTTSAIRAQEVTEDVLWAAFFGANLHFSRLGTDYFSQDRLPSPVEHYWSLAVEEQFYLVWPAVLALMVWVASGTRHVTPTARARSRVPVLTAVVGLVWLTSFALSVQLTARNAQAAYFSSPARAWELATGALLALNAPLWRRLPQSARRILPVVGLAVLAFAAVEFDDRTPFPGWRAIVPVLATAGPLIAGAAGGPEGPARVLVGRGLTWIGDLSYSLYLWHWPVLVLGARHTDGAPRFVNRCLLLTVALVLSIASYYLVENPLRRGRIRLARGQLALLLWPAAICAVLLTTTWADLHATEVTDARVKAAQAWYRQHRTPPPSLKTTPTTPPRPSAATKPVPTTPLTRSIARALAFADQAAPLPYPILNLQGLSDDIWNKQGYCYAGYAATTVGICPLGDEDAHRTVVAIGDSHMAMWLPALDTLGRRHGFRVIPFVKLSCPAFDVPMRSLTRAGPYTECTAFRRWSREQIARLHPSLALMGARGWPPELIATDHSRAPVWARGVRTAARHMHRLVPEVRVLGDLPRSRRDPDDCLTDSKATMATCVFPERRFVKVVNAVTRRASRRAGVDYVDLVPLVCLDRRCPPIVDHRVTYRDDDHISATWSRHVARDLGKLLDLPRSLTR